jgi:hypothetical protein
LTGNQNTLIVEAGGYDVFIGMPLYFILRALGKSMG